MLTFGMILLGCCMTVCTDDQSEWTVEKLARGLQARDRALKSYILDAQYQVRTRSDLTGLVLDSATAEHIEVDRPSRRFFVHKVGQAYVPPSPSVGRRQESFIVKDELIAFDGERTRVMSQTPGLDPSTGLESKTMMKYGKVYKGRQATWTIDPELYVGVLLEKPVGDSLLKAPYQIVPAGSPGNVAVECEFGGDRDKNQPRWKARFEIDVAKNLAVVDYEGWIKHANSSRWESYLKITAEDWVEVDGFWLPRRSRLQHHNAQDSGERQLVSDIIATLSTWVVNPDIPDQRFKIGFEPKTIVTDTDRGQTYRVGDITDHKLAENARAASELRERFETTRAELKDRPRDKPGWGWRPLGAALVGLVLIALLSVWALRRAKWAGTGGSSGSNPRE